jgi:hypothetical protein
VAEAFCCEVAMSTEGVSHWLPPTPLMTGKVTAMANPFQLALLVHYPAADLLPINTHDPQEVDRIVHEEPATIGDGLFVFLWRELAEAGSNAEEALRALRRTIEDIEAVRTVIEHDDLAGIYEDVNCG